MANAEHQQRVYEAVQAKTAAADFGQDLVSADKPGHADYYLMVLPRFSRCDSAIFVLIHYNRPRGAL